MQVILLERIEKLGQMGQTVTVKQGYARNYLLPKKKALRATESNVKHFESQRAQLEARNLTHRADAEHVAKKMAGLTVTLIRQASEVGHLYGSVRAQDIAEVVQNKGYTVTKGQVVLSVPIKTLGMHQAKIMVHPEVEVLITVQIAQSEEEANAQLEKQAAAKTTEEA
ncbi:50S ribosomal protein L9 [Candidatus Finniella inopinata]|uniref:Large ribosomal subunit protein bL9 n=1 Tax=Candidatus Finniella inopinata TaxID=1696036 RepID=A0A4Q7DJ43_9PROT|nr:50S ribosomal protein L9 [Candidatus Finniella inopinata]RZI46044.1 50S ribosomal protein L9 [Candidatus Finniella inopinata]